MMSWSRYVIALLAAAVALSSSLPTATPMPDTVRIPPVEPRPTGSPFPPALFRHGKHGQLNCYACHPSLFPQHPKGFTHAEMDAGAYCGACHDGSAAFAVRGTPCEVCHAAR